MNETFIQHAQHDVDRDDCRQHQQQFVRQRCLQRRRGTLEGSDEAFRQADVGLGLADGGDRRAE